MVLHPRAFYDHLMLLYSGKVIFRMFSMCIRERVKSIRIDIFGQNMSDVVWTRQPILLLDLGREKRNYKMV